MLSKRAINIEDSPTLALNAKARELKDQGVNVINLTAGELDFPTPRNVCEKAKEAIDNDFTKYTASDGTKDLKLSIIKKFKKDNRIDYKLDEVIASNGAKQSLFNSFQVLCDKGDEVIISKPCWGTFVEQIKLSLAKPVFINLKSPFKLTAQEVKAKISKKTKVLLINTPSNPCSSVIEPEELKKIAKLAVEHNFYVIADEIYEKLIFEKEHLSIASINKQIKERTITINGVSKSQSMTGWRLGFLGGPKEIVRAMNKFQVQTTSNPCSISQVAALEGLEDTEFFHQMVAKKLKERRDLVLEKLKKIKGLEFHVPEGGFYFFISIKKLIKKNQTSKDWCEDLLKQKKVVVVPGEAFYYPGYFRLSFAASKEDLLKSVKRIREFVAGD
jgi:aspartate aminotransferase